MQSVFLTSFFLVSTVLTSDQKQSQESIERDNWAFSATKLKSEIEPFPNELLQRMGEGIVSTNRDQRMSHGLLYPPELSFLSKLFFSLHNINILDFVYIFLITLFT